MTDTEFREARTMFLAEGRVTEELLLALRGIVGRLVAFGNLPPMYSPTGSWDEDAEEEVFADWIESRLVGTGQLAALLQQTGTERSFVRLGELYLRRHLINQLERSHATNLFGRLRALLAEDSGTFEVLMPSSREQDVVWTLAAGDADAGLGAVFDSGEDRLLSLAWGLGEFETVRFRDDARKLSHVLERDELIRFVVGLMQAAGADGGVKIDRRLPDLREFGPDAQAGLGPSVLMDHFGYYIVERLRGDYPDATVDTSGKRAVEFSFHAPVDISELGEQIDPYVDFVIGLARVDARGLWIPNRALGCGWDVADPEYHLEVMNRRPTLELRSHRAHAEIRVARQLARHLSGRHVVLLVRAASFAKEHSQLGSASSRPATRSMRSQQTNNCSSASPTTAPGPSSSMPPCSSAP